MFNGYFWSIFTRENSFNLSHLRNHVQASWSTSSIDKVVISEDAVFEVLCKIDPSKACGPDDIPGCLLKEGAPWLAEPPTQLFNLSLQSGVLPRDWRRANITLVFKKGDKHSPSNYRPISLTTLVVKCLEHTKILEFLEANNLVVISMDFVKGTHARLSYLVQSMSGVDPWISDSLHMSSTLIFPECSTLYHTRG